MNLSAHSANISQTRFCRIEHKRQISPCLIPAKVCATAPRIKCSNGCTIRWKSCDLGAQNLTYPLSLRDIEGIMQERGVCFDHATVHLGTIKVLPVLAAVFPKRKRPVGSNWRIDETYIKVARKWKYLYRAVHRTCPA